MMRKGANDRVLVIAAHPDDEVLGCGGTIAKFVENGAAVSVIFIAEGSSARYAKEEINSPNSLDDQASRKRAAYNAANILGHDIRAFFDFPNLRMAQPDLDLVKRIEAELSLFKPTMVITHHFGDANTDHRAVFEAVYVACRPFSGYSPDCVLSFPVGSSTEWAPQIGDRIFSPNFYVAIAPQVVEKKLRALDVYEDEMRPSPHPRSPEVVRAQSLLYGSQIGTPHAEAFYCHRFLS